MEDEFEKRIRNVCKSIRMVADAEVAKAPVKKFSDKRIEDFFTQFYGLSYEPKQMVVDLPGPLFLPDGEFQVAALTLPAGVDPDSVLVMAYTNAGATVKQLRVTSDPFDSSADVFLEQKQRSLSAEKSGPCAVVIRLHEDMSIFNIQIRYQVSYPTY